MRKNRFSVILAVLMAAMLVLAACGKKESLSETMQNAWSASMEMKSFTFDGSFKLDKLEIPSMNEVEQGYLDMFRNISVSVSGAYTQDPLQMEMNLKLTIPGDLAISFDMPVIMTADKMYIRVPDIPLFPLGDAAGKFIEFDLAELAEQEGVELPAIPTVDVELQRQLSVDLLNIVMKHLDENEYFQELKKDEVPGLPEDAKADRYVKFSIMNDNFEPFMLALAEKILPEIIDLLLENEAYRTALGVSEAELNEAKTELSANDSESLRQELEELKDTLKIHELSVTAAIKGDYMVYEVLKADLEGKDQQGDTVRIGVTFDIRYDNINGDVKFEHGIPTDTISIYELEPSFLFDDSF